MDVQLELGVEVVEQQDQQSMMECLNLEELGLPDFEVVTPAERCCFQ